MKREMSGGRWGHRIPNVCKSAELRPVILADAAALARFLYYAVIGFSHMGELAISERDLAVYLAMFANVP
ncbi:hypothetical protein [Rugamonas rubra]|uniref:hypothetical protein n=1 Tax=Rugamonas rubra TaxID=758825 RepID=UPI00111359AF|nr:hypothetical protein [Rugamonas rubra]